MAFDIHEHAHSAQAALHVALAELERARSAYETGAGPRFAQAKAAQATLAAKIEAAEGEAAAADAAFQAAFSAAGFERDEATRAQLNRKNDAQAMAEALRAALARGAKELQALAAEASTQARDYAGTYERAYVAHAQAEGYRALQEGGEQLARAMALAAHAPRSDSIHEDALGRPASSPAMRAEIAAARWAFILDGLKAMAEQLPEFDARPQVQALGAFDLGAMQPPVKQKRRSNQAAALFLFPVQGIQRSPTPAAHPST